MAKASSKRRKRSASRKGNSGGMAPWYIAAVLVIGGIAAYDHRAKLPDLPGASKVVAMLSPKETKTRPVAAARATAKPKEHTGSIVRKSTPVPPALVAGKSALAPPAPVGRPMEQPTPRFADSNTFYFCGIRNDNCVVDGDTFLFKGEKILIADIDAPETKEAKCEAERARGFYAKQRLRELLNAGKFTVVASRGGGGKEGGTPHLVMRNGRSLGDVLVSEGLVRKRAGEPSSWCGRSVARVSG
ncbi:thermonuclease family protein [Sinorhizobium garamanticum]|uniref:Thermonuclease family protein n=1 Tax=Sinorhizobium garamanticum TaxID=680247 RepID=A0ABY8D674_9HYPH|nr:thermonuclease family protein [Sinorhizobium garamanticum]WEX86360.1 thermonuclease family protein [Sinorhizobium garamanticum]